MTSGCPFHQAMAQEHRADPYPFYADVTGEITKLDDGRYVVSRYDDVLALLHDPRLSSAGREDGDAAAPDPTERVGMSLLRLDPPEHDRLRRIVMRQFGPPNRPRMVHDLEGEIVRVVNDLLDDMAAMGGEAEVVGAFAHRLPIAIICKLFGIPVAFEDRFRSFVDVIVSGIGQRQLPPEVGEAMKKLGGLLFETAKQRRGGDGDDLLSGLVNDDGPEGAAGLALAALSASVSGGAKTLLIFAGFMLFNFMTNLGPNAQTYLLAGEVFPTRIRGKGAGFAAAFAKVGAVLTAFMFPILLTSIGTTALLTGLIVTSLLGAVVTWLTRIETTGINLDALEQQPQQI